MNSYTAPLISLGIIEIYGEDARDFLHGQLTSDIRLLTEGQSAWSAWCQANGRVIATFIVTLAAGHYYLILPVDMVEATCRRLKMFVLRSKVNIDDITGSHGCIGVNLDRNEFKPDELLHRDFSIVPAAVPNDPARAIWITAHHELPALFAGLDAPGTGTIDEQRWRLQDVLAGMPWVHTQTSEQALPQELNLERLGGLSYDKGCYPGQEIIARMHFRGQLKRRLCKGTLESGHPLPAPGTKLSGATETHSAGLVLTAARGPDENAYLLMIVDTGLATGGTAGLENGTLVHYVPIAVPAGSR